jgi:hypothetical protein
VPPDAVFTVRTYAATSPALRASDKVPADRPMDSIDASGFLLGESESTSRENILFFGPDGSCGIPRRLPGRGEHRCRRFFAARLWDHPGKG